MLTFPVRGPYFVAIHVLELKLYLTSIVTVHRVFIIVLVKFGKVSCIVLRVPLILSSFRVYVTIGVLIDYFLVYSYFKKVVLQKQTLNSERGKNDGFLHK